MVKEKKKRSKKRKLNKKIFGCRIWNLLQLTIVGSFLWFVINLNNSMQHFYNLNYDHNIGNNLIQQPTSSRRVKHNPHISQEVNERRPVDDPSSSSSLSSLSSLSSPSSQCTTFLTDTKRSFPFYPKQFFEQGPGQQFLPLLEHTMNNFTDILNARFLVYNYTESCHLVYFHIHKNGGTTMERHVPFAVDNFYSKREKAMGHEEFESASRDVMKNVYLLQQLSSSLPPPSNRREVNVFTFLRDPIDRFLSSLAQVLKLRTWHKRLYPCYNYNSTKDLVDCVLTKMENGTTFLDMHLTPQSFELYKEIMGFNIRIDLMDISEINGVLSTLGVRNVPRERSVTGKFIRRFPQFHLTKDILTPDLEKRICNIYRPDVVMLEHTGVTTTRCLVASHGSIDSNSNPTPHNEGDR